MTLGWGTDNRTLRDTSLDEIERRFAASGLTTRYYTSEVHKAAFALPRFIGDIVADARREAGKAAC